MGAFAEFMVRYCAQATRGYTVVHANFFMSGQAGLQIWQAPDIPLVVTFHALELVRRQCQGACATFAEARIEIENVLVRSADAIIAEGPPDETDLLTLCHVDPHRIAGVPCGFDAREFHPVPGATARAAALGGDTDAFAILQPSRRVPRKGINNMIRVLRVMLDDIGGARPARLYLVGGGDARADVRRCSELRRLSALVWDAAPAQSRCVRRAA